MSSATRQCYRRKICDECYGSSAESHFAARRRPRRSRRRRPRRGPAPASRGGWCRRTSARGPGSRARTRGAPRLAASRAGSTDLPPLLGPDAPSCVRVRTGPPTRCWRRRRIRRASRSTGPRGSTGPSSTRAAAWRRRPAGGTRSTGPRRRTAPRSPRSCAPVAAADAPRPRGPNSAYVAAVAVSTAGSPSTCSAMSSMCTPMSISGPPPAVARRVNQLPSVGDALAAQPAGLGVVDLAEHSGVDDLLQRLDVAAAAVVERHIEHPVIAFGRRHHLPGLRRVLGHRLLRRARAGRRRGRRPRPGGAAWSGWRC